MNVKIKNKEDLYKKLKLWKEITSKKKKGEHFDLTNDSEWIKNIKEVKSIVDNLKNTEDPEEIRKLLTKLFRRGKNQLIWANQTFMLSSFINECTQDELFQLKELIIDVANSEQFKKEWAEKLFSILEKRKPKSVERFPALRGILTNIFGELFGKLHIKKYPIMNSCSRSFLKPYFEFNEDDYNSFVEAFESFKRIYLEKVGKLSELELNIEIDQIFNYFDKTDILKEVLKIILEEMREKHFKEWSEFSPEFMNKIADIKRTLLNVISKSKVTEEDVEEFYKKIDPIERSSKIFMRGCIFRYKRSKQITLQILNDDRVKNFLKHFEKADSIEGLSKMDVWDVKEIGGTVLTSLGAIVNRKLIIPIHENTVNKKVAEMSGLKEQFWNGSDKSTREDVERFLISLKKAAENIGIDELFEAAFYLTKYGKDTEIDERLKKKIDSLINTNKQVILYGPPGTGKTWTAQAYVEEVLREQGKGGSEFVTFHPSYSYEEFVEGLKPISAETAENNLRFIVDDGIFKRIAIRAICEALKSAENKVANEVLELLNKIENGDFKEYSRYIEKKIELWNYIRKLDKTELRNLFVNAPKFYLIIDEINRGDISRIFGELITLLEADKRLGERNQIILTLPYSKEPFAVPPNLYIIGTMNTADRSIALIDVALRRRFGFIELMPNYKVLEEKLLNENVSDDVKEIRELSIKVLRSINDKIKKIYDRDHQIGHSYFLKLEKCKTRYEAIKTLKYIWFYEIIPLLQEYFYDSPKKLKDILKDFVIVDESTYELKQMEEFNDDQFIEALRNLIEGGEGSG